MDRPAALLGRHGHRDRGDGDGSDRAVEAVAHASLRIVGKERAMSSSDDIIERTKTERYWTRDHDLPYPDQRSARPTSVPIPYVTAAAAAANASWRSPERIGLVPVSRVMPAPSVKIATPLNAAATIRAG